MSIQTSDSLVEVPGGDIFVRQWHCATSRGSPLLLLHDSLGSVAQWRDFPASLAAAANRLATEFSSWSLDPWLGRVSCPVLALHGDQDPYGSEAFPRRIASRVSGPSEMVLLEACGHVPHRERPEEIVRLAAAFLLKAEVGGV